MFQSQRYADVANLFADFEKDVKYFGIKEDGCIRKGFTLHKILSIDNSLPKYATVVTSSVSAIECDGKMFYELHGKHTFHFMIEWRSREQNFTYKHYDTLHELQVFLGGLEPLTKETYNAGLKKIQKMVDDWIKSQQEDEK